jgi:Ca2+-binding RTX toxin-like protein
VARIAGTDGADKLHGARENDDIRGLAGDDSLYGGKGDDTLQGGSGADLLVGGDGDDRLRDDSKDAGSTIRGGGGDDVIESTAARLIFGGEGHDRLSYRFAATTDDIIVDLRELGGGGVVDLGDTRVWGVEEITRIVFGAGDDMLIMNDAGNTLLTNGLAGDDTLLGGAGDDAFAGDFDNDLLEGRAGDDQLWGGRGRDTVRGGGGDDLLVETVMAGDDLFGGKGFDTAWINFRHGVAAVADFSAAGEASVNIGGGVLIGSIEQLVLQLTDHADSILLGDYLTSTLRARDGDDTIAGAASAEFLAGEDGDDLLSGGAGDDRLYGGKGDDTISGGEGKDYFRGGAGADRFIMTGEDGATDFIDDLTEADVIDLSALDADSTQAGDQAFVLVQAFSGAAAEAVMIGGRKASRLELDTDGDGRADITVELDRDQTGFENFVL